MRERTYEIKIEGVPIIVTKKRMKNMYLRISKEGRYSADLSATSDE